MPHPHLSIVLQAVSLPPPPAPGAAEAAAPAWVHLIPSGTVRGADGRGPYTLGNPAAVIAASKLPLVIDENHATDLAAPRGGSAPARGWVVALDARADGVWGQVNWTPSGAALLAERAYRSVSPVLGIRRERGEIISLLRASLTNVPNLPQLTTLHAQQGVTMELMTRLRALLGLDEVADETAVITALEAVMGDRTMHAQALAATRKALGLDDKAALGSIATVLQARLGAAGTATELQAQVTALQSQLAEVQGAAVRERAVAAVDAAIRAGKPVQARREAYIARFAQDPAGTQADLDALPSLHSGGIQPGHEAPGADGFTAGDRAVIELMGIDPAAYLKTKAAQGVALIGSN